MEHYGLDEAFAYSISRAHFLWDEGHVEDLSGLTVTFYEQDVHVPGEHFTLTGGKQEIPLVHPVSGEKFALHIDRIEANELPEEHLERMNSIRRDRHIFCIITQKSSSICYTTPIFLRTT